MSSPSQTQARRILMLLHAAWPNWVPAPALARISLQYCARVRELRKSGYTISNRTEQHGRQKNGFYRLGSKPIEKPGALFGDIAPDRSYRE